MQKLLTSSTLLPLTIRTIVWLVRVGGNLLSPRLMGLMLRGCGFIASYMRRREMAIAVAQIEAVKRHCEQAQQHQFFRRPSVDAARESFAHVAQSFAETLLIPKMMKHRSQYIEAEGDELVDALLAAKEGAVCLSGHLGCFELLAAYYVSRGVPLSVIGRYPNFEFLGELADSIRAGYGVKVIWRKSSSSGRKLYGSLKQGNFLAALIDQDTKLESKFSPFLGLEAAHPISAIRLAIRLKRPIFSSFIMRTSASKHRVITRQISYDAASPTVEQEVLDEFSRQFEALVLQYPDQWIWWHRRWRRRPEIDYQSNPEQLRGTKQYLAWLNAV